MRNNPPKLGGGQTVTARGKPSASRPQVSEKIRLSNFLRPDTLHPPHALAASVLPSNNTKTVCIDHLSLRQTLILRMEYLPIQIRIEGKKMLQLKSLAPWAHKFARRSLLLAGATTLLASLAFVPTVNAQVVISLTPPVCSFGYYDYAPYACAPSGFYGPGYFYGGVFLGVGPWANWGYGHGWGGHRFSGGGGGSYRGAGGNGGGRVSAANRGHGSAVVRTSHSGASHGSASARNSHATAAHRSASHGASHAQAARGGASHGSSHAAASHGGAAHGGGSHGGGERK